MASLSDCAHMKEHKKKICPFCKTHYIHTFVLHTPLHSFNMSRNVKLLLIHFIISNHIRIKKGYIHTLGIVFIMCKVLITLFSYD